MWVFGMADCTSNPAMEFMQIVDRRNAEIIQIAAYNRVENIDGLMHHTVNHMLHFVDPVTGVHAQNIIESYWNKSNSV